jgi:hypothetical protein
LSYLENGHLKQLGNWSYHAGRIRQSSITEAEKNQAIEALNALRGYLGSNWLSNAAEEGHAVVSYWMSSFTSDFAAEWVIDFAKKLQSLSSDKNFKKLLDDIRGANSYPGADGELELASRMALNGYKVELRPSVGDKKEADIKLITTSGPVYFEIKSLQIPKDEQESRDYQAWGYRMAGDLSCGLHGQIHKRLSPKHKEQIGKMIQAAAKEAKETQKPQEIIEERVITAVIETDPSPTSEHLLKWLSERNLNFAFHGPNFDIAEREYRIKRVFEEAKEQIPKSDPSIIVIYPHRLLQLYQEGPLGFLADPYEENIYSQDNLVAGVLVDKYLLTQPNMRDKAIRESNYVMLKQIFYNTLHENTLIIKNKFSNIIPSIDHPEDFFKKTPLT